MKVNFELKEKTGKDENGREFKYYVLERQLVDGSQLSISIKGDKLKLLLMSLNIESKLK